MNEIIAVPEIKSELHIITDLLRSRIMCDVPNVSNSPKRADRLVAIDPQEVIALCEALSIELACDTECSETQYLQQLREHFDLQPPEYVCFLLALAVELDGRFCRIIAYLNDHVSITRPTLGLALDLAGPSLGCAHVSGRPAFRTGLLLLDGAGPVPSQTVRIASDVLARLTTGNATQLPSGVRHRRCGPALDQLLIEAQSRAKLKRWADEQILGATNRPLLLSGAPGSGRTTAAFAASSLNSRSLVETEWHPDRESTLLSAVREAIWQGATLLLRTPEELSPQDVSLFWTQCSAWQQLPVAVACSPAALEELASKSSSPPVIVQIPALTVEQREILWSHQSGLPSEQVAQLAARYDFSPGLIARAVRRAQHETDGTPDFSALSRSCRAVGSANMSSIAQRLPQPFTRADLVLPASLHEELDLAAAWIRNRSKVFENWGFGRRISLGQGLTALFAGEPGTGKTMTAQVLACELGLDLFRVDLSRLMSKYIGQTEKHLSSLFDDARASGAILFFDEADALFGKRTEVQDAQDRYANLEIGYLLQRMEEHPGVTMLATNRMRDLDEAFIRRFHFILDFPMPTSIERRLIWAGMLPSDAAVEPHIDLGQLAEPYEISGGDIRNAVMSAAFMAANEGSAITMRHLKRGLRRELLKMGRMLDAKKRADLAS
jgi:MoxR-like ATPase